MDHLHSFTILSVNPGTKYIGLAVFHVPDLVYWGVRVLKGKWSEKKLRSAEVTVLNLMKYYNVDTVVLKRFDLFRSSSNLDSLTALVKKIARRKRNRIILYSMADLREFFASGERVNKMIIASFVIKHYPFLNRDLDREKKCKHPYSVRMFEAIAAGVFAFNQNEKK